MVVRVAIILAALALLGCEARLVLGGRCARSGDCPAPLVCALGRCRAECATSRDCTIGARCLADPATAVGACSLDGDRCSAGCPSGFVCLSGTDDCVNACGGIVRCPDGTCMDGACVPSREPVDGGAGDAALDAGDAGDAPCHGPGCDPIHLVAIGWDTMFAVTRSGALWAWGESANGETGDGLVAHGDCADCAPLPVLVLDETGAPFDDVKQVVAGENHVCVLREEGSVWCWGAVESLGNGGVVSSVPVRVERTDGTTFDVLEPASDVAAGRDHTCALTMDGEVWCWGLGGMGALGLGATDAAPRALRASLPMSMAIDATFGRTMTLSANVIGGVGENVYRELGAVSPSGFALDYVTSMVDDARALGMAGDATCAIRGSDEEIWCWGAGTWGSFGAGVDCTGDGEICSEVPQRMLRPSAVTTWAGVVGDRRGASFFSWSDDGTLYAFGASVEGVLGPGLSRVVDPRPREGVPPVTSVAAANAAVCVATIDGDVLCWGAGYDGQLGRGTHGPDVFSDVPAPVLWP